MELFDVSFDGVIKSAVASGSTTYADALQRFLPLIDRFEEQRKLQRPKFYERLKKDIVSGCIMPPITLAFIDPTTSKSTVTAEIAEFVNRNISEGYILDGMQRLNVLDSAKDSEGFDGDRPIYFNIIVAEKYDLLLYRMITLNNGQKPMTVRHQVEMLTGNLVVRMSAAQGLRNMSILREKETETNSPRGSFRMVDVASAYLAFLTNSAHNQNSRFIEEKLDEILVGKVMASGVVDDEVSFELIVREVDRLSENTAGRDWLRNENNLIGFTLGAKRAIHGVQAISPDEFSRRREMFEEAFQAINPSKVNVGKFRRDLSTYFVSTLDSSPSVDDLTEKFFDLTAN